MSELIDVWPSKELSISYEVLEKLPYLVSHLVCRLSHATLTESKQIFRGRGRGGDETIVGIGSTFVPLNEKHFPNPIVSTQLQPGTALG